MFEHDCMELFNSMNNFHYYISKQTIIQTKLFIFFCIILIKIESFLIAGFERLIREKIKEQAALHINLCLIFNYSKFFKN